MLEIQRKKFIFDRFGRKQETFMKMETELSLLSPPATPPLESNKVSQSTLRRFGEKE